MTYRYDPLTLALEAGGCPATVGGAGTPNELLIVAYGEPVGQGSKNASPRGGVYDANAKRLHPWRFVVAAAAQEAIEARYGPGRLPLFGRGTPVHVGMVFTFARPASHFGTGRNACLLKASAPREHLSAPDVDKAQRAILDALAMGGVVADDRQFSRVTEAARVYPGGHPDALDIPGVVIRVRG